MIEMFAAFVTHNLTARGYPSRPVTLVVPFEPGSVDDLGVRRIAARAEQATSQALKVENRPKRSGNDARRHVERSCPDGYTVLLTRDENQASRYRVSGPWFVPWDAIACLQRLIDDAP
jgi:tripartite-type tricarboxylate transporter receptor subunit TctC